MQKESTYSKYNNIKKSFNIIYVNIKSNKFKLKNKIYQAFKSYIYSQPYAGVRRGEDKWQGKWDS